MTRSLSARRTLAAAALAPLLVAGLASCGDDGPAATDASSESTAASASPADAPTAGETVDPASFIDDVLGGLTDASTAHLEMTMKGGPAAMSMQGDVDYSKTPPEMAVTMTNKMLGDGEIGIRLVNGVMYMQLPQLGSGKWIKMDLSGKDSPLGDDLLKQMNPGTQLKAMKDAVTKVEYVGDDSVGKHYTMTVRSDAFRDLEKQLGSAGTSAADKLPSVLTYDLWTDDDGNLSQTEIALGDLGSVTTKTSKWGEPVDIKAPPAGDIMELPTGAMPGTTAS